MDLKAVLYSVIVNVLQLNGTWTVACALTIIIACLLWYEKWSRRRFDKLASGLPGPKSYPFIGSVHHFIGSTEHVMSFILKLFTTYSPNQIKLWLGRSFAITVIKPQDLQIVLNNSNALGKGLFDEWFKCAIGEGLICAPVHKWKKHRRIITPMFNAISMNQFIHVFNEKNQILVKNIMKEVGNVQTFDIWNYIEPTTLDIICECAMGCYDNVTTSNGASSSFVDTLTQAISIAIIRASRPWLYPDFMFSIYLKLTGKDKVFEELNKIPIHIINERKKEIKNLNKVNNSNALDDDHQQNQPVKTFLDRLLEMNDSETTFSDEEIKDEVLTMMAAGTETNAVTLCFCFLLLAMHPDIQDKVYDEIYEVLGDGDEFITIEDANKLVYLDQVLKETLRLYPTVPLIFRELRDDVKIDTENRILPKGTMCVLFILGIHRFADVYPNPLSFNPEHFSQENIAKRHKYSFIPFGGGPRSCLGSKFAMLSMKVAVATFLRNFSVHTIAKQNDIKLKLEVVMKSVHGYPVTIRLRDKRPSYRRY